MIVFLAVLMTIGILAVPVHVDIKKHGHDNILRRSQKDLARYFRVAEGLSFLRTLTEYVVAAFWIAVAIAIIWVLWMIFG